MNTILLAVDREHPDESVIRQAGEILKNGGLVAFPTETVYGLGGDGLNAESSEKIYAAKGRPSDNPLIIDVYKRQVKVRRHDQRGRGEVQYHDFRRGSRGKTARGSSAVRN